MCKDEETVGSLIEDIELLCFMEQPFNEVIYEFKRNGILFESTRQLNTLMSLLADVYNNTRTWNNRGYTAKEMNEILEKNISLVTGIPIDKLNDVIFKKVGRNIRSAAADRNCYFYILEKPFFKCYQYRPVRGANYYHSNYSQK